MGEVSFCRARPGTFATFDARYAPIYITTFRGRIEVEDASWHTDVSHTFFDADVRANRPIFYITDAREMEAPSAKVRRFWGQEMDVHPETTEKVLENNVIVINNAFLRGALTAVQWLMQRKSGMRYVTTLEEAIEEGIQFTLKKGLPRPKLDPRTYTPPSPPSEREPRLPKAMRG
jgi:hypothetical protein